MAAKELFNTSLFLDANLQAYYRCNSGALTTDSKNSNTLTNYNSVSEDSGIFGGCANGNGSNYLYIDNSLNIDGGSCTFSFWLKLNSEISSGFYYLIGQGNNNSKTTNWIRYDYNNGTRRIAFRRSRVGIEDTDFSYNITLGTSNWYHIVYTYNGSNIIGYINGNSVGSVGAGGNGSETTLNIFRFLNHAGSTGYPTNGKIDDVAIFNRALSESEVSNLYNGNYPDRIKKVKTNWFF